MTGWDTDLEVVLRAAHARLSRDPAARTFTVDLPDLAGRDALADLLGLARRPARRAVVHLRGDDGLARAVQDASGRSLEDELADRFGPFVDPAATRRAQRAAKDELWRWWLTHPEITADPALTTWARSVQATGVRGEDPRLVLERVLVVLAELPVADTLLPVLAGRLLHDTHALDAGSPTAALVLGAVAASQGVDRPTDAAGRRDLWRSVGVLDDELSSTVLVAGFRPTGSTVGARICRTGAGAADVVALTLAQVRAGVDAWDAPQVHVVENPAILALAVAELGTSVPPMVCTSGWPSGAVTTLLRDLAASGARLRHHGDLDGEGLRITAHLAQLVGAEPWRMTRADYLARVPSHGAGVGRVTEVPWDPDLAAALRSHGVAVLEENVWPQLADDLRAAAGLA
ncbi:MAG TPA: TIGR02679 family protein [Cellulomonas sp.]